MNESSNHSVFSINTICNYDRDIIPYIHAEIGSVYIRTGSNTFEIDDAASQYSLINKSDKFIFEDIQ